MGSQLYTPLVSLRRTKLDESKHGECLGILEYGEHPFESLYDDLKMSSTLADLTP